MRYLGIYIGLAAMLCGDLYANPEAVEFGSYFTDGMVLQRGKPIRVSGFASQNATVTVTFGGQKKDAAVNKDGEWTVTLDPMPPNAKPQELRAQSSLAPRPLSLGNVLVGDVIMVARQTSIDISLGRDAEGRKVASAHKKNPAYRAISIKTIPSAKPLNDLDKAATDGWQEVNGDSALKMTASAYYLGRDLAADLDVPIGIIDLNLGHAFPISWLSRETLSETETFYGRTDVPGQIKRFDEAVERSATNGAGKW